jgi:hypothetical protein
MRAHAATHTCLLTRLLTRRSLLCPLSCSRLLSSRHQRPGAHHRHSTCLLARLLTHRAPSQHVNINSASFDEPAQFFFEALGMVAASYCGPRIIHANMGLSQIHMPIDAAAPQTWTGTVGLAYSQHEFDKAWALLSAQSDWHAEKVSATEIGTVGPHGNRYHLHVVGDAWVSASRGKYASDLPSLVVTVWFFSDRLLAIAARGSIHRDQTDKEGKTCDGDDSRCAGMLYVTVNVAPGKAARIANFYRAAFGASPVVEATSAGHSCTVPIGTAEHGQSIVYLDTEGDLPEYDGHHLAIYLNDYAGGYTASAEQGLIWNNPRFNDMPNTVEEAMELAQFRMKDIVDMETGEVLLELEHEIRGYTNKLCPLVN